MRPWCHPNDDSRWNSYDGKIWIGIQKKGLCSYGNAGSSVEQGKHEPSERQPRVDLYDLYQAAH